MTGWNTSFFFWDGLFAGAMLVSRSAFHSCICPNEWQTLLWRTPKTGENANLTPCIICLCFFVRTHLQKNVRKWNWKSSSSSNNQGTQFQRLFFLSKYQFLHSRVHGCDVLIWMSSIFHASILEGFTIKWVGDFCWRCSTSRLLMSSWNELLFYQQIQGPPRLSTNGCVFQRFGSVGYKPNIISYL